MQTTYMAKPSEVEKKWYVLDAADTVSYTHLDVYKRQPIMWKSAFKADFTL